jgi:nitrate/nitrite-specific signal transduction histidine kinase
VIGAPANRLLAERVFHQSVPPRRIPWQGQTGSRVQLSLKAVDYAIYGLVLDNGRGFVVSERNHLPGHLGLLALRERSMLARGWTKIESEPGIGTKVEFWTPDE